MRGLFFANALISNDGKISSVIFVTLTTVILRHCLSVRVYSPTSRIREQNSFFLMSEQP
jgi:hypothetical protein